MDSVAKWIDDRDCAEPFWKPCDRRNGSTWEEEQGVENTEHGARHKRVFDAHHHQEHHSIEGDGSGDNEQGKLQQHQGMKDNSETGEQRAYHREAYAREDSLNGACEIESHDQFKPGNWGNEVAFVNTACFVVDVQHS